MKSGRIAPSLLLLLVASTTACGSKTGILSAGESIDAAPPDTDAGFDTFPCRWSYGQPLILGRGSGRGVWAGLGGAVHGRVDTIWVRADNVSAGDGRVSQRLALGDPPRVLDPSAPTVSPWLQGLEDGWVALASDCSLGFFDDEARPRRLVVDAFSEPPCRLERLDRRFIDVTFEGGGAVAARYDSEGTFTYSIPSPRPSATLRTVTSLNEDFAFAFVADPGSMVLTTLISVPPAGPGTGLSRVGESIGGLSTSVDRLRPAALALLPGRGTTTLMRLPFDPTDLTPEVFATTSDGALDPDDALVTNETEALMVLSDGRIAIQPLSGSAMRFLEPPELPSAGRIEQLKVLLAPGESRGGALYSYIEPSGESVLAFRTLVCNR